MPKDRKEHTSEPFTIPDLELVKLKLALLKENFKFQEFYEKLKSDPYSTCPELRRPEEKNYEEYRSRVFYFEAVGGYKGDQKDAPTLEIFGGYAKHFSHLGVHNKFFIAVGDPYSIYPELRKKIKQESAKISIDDILLLLDPQRDVSEVSSSALMEMLPFLFYSVGVKQLSLGPHNGPRLDEYGKRFWLYKMPISLYSWERLIKIDLRVKKSQLIEEFKKILDKNYKSQEAAIEVESRLRKEGADYTLETAYEWDPDLSRNRIKEGWEQLEVWKLRKQRKSFQRISLEMGQSEDVTKKRFYRAFELILGEKYDKSFWKGLIHERLERMARETDKNFKKNIWDDVAALEEIKQQHKILKKESINKWSSDEVESDPLYTMNLLLDDIEKICSKCTDTDCYNQFKEAIKNDKWEIWDACPDIYELLKP